MLPALAALWFFHTSTDLVLDLALSCDAPGRDV